MYTFQAWLDVRRTRLFDELREAKESLKFGWHCVQERRSKYIHALDVCKIQLVGFLSIWYHQHTKK
jgi:hypothetical protein